MPTGAAEPTPPGRSLEGLDTEHREEAGLRLSLHTGFAINFECFCVYKVPQVVQEDASRKLVVETG